MTHKMRRVEILVAPDTWVECEFKDLKFGNVFRLWEPDNILAEGIKSSVAISNAYPVGNKGNYGVDVDVECNER